MHRPFHPTARSQARRALPAFPVLAVLALPAAPAAADLVGTDTVGSGQFASFVLFQFDDADQWLFEVRYDALGLTGRDLLDVIAAERDDVVFDIVSFSFGDALEGVTIGERTNSGFGTPPDFLDFWHYWVRPEASAEWGFADTGFSDRLVSDGSWDGWVFGSNAAPIPAPAGAWALLALARRRRRG